MKALLILPLAVLLKGCPHEVPAGDFCNIANRTIYNGGDFKLTSSEIAGLERGTKEKIVALKRTYKAICLQ